LNNADDEDTTIAMDSGTICKSSYATSTINNTSANPPSFYYKSKENVSKVILYGQMGADICDELLLKNIRVAAFITDSAPSILKGLRVDTSKDSESFNMFVKSPLQEFPLHIQCLCHLLQRALIKAIAENEKLNKF
jgi:hypothetical protein